MSEENLSKITETLLAGGKMLGVHCGKCKSPLFEYKGEVVCPVCRGKTKSETSKVEPKSQTLKKLDKVLNAKLDALTEQLENESDQAKVLKLLDSIKSTLEALERLKKTEKS